MLTTNAILGLESAQKDVEIVRNDHIVWKVSYSTKTVLFVIITVNHITKVKSFNCMVLSPREHLMMTLSNNICSCGDQCDKDGNCPGGVGGQTSYLGRGRIHMILYIQNNLINKLIYLHLLYRDFRIKYSCSNCKPYNVF